MRILVVRTTGYRAVISERKRPMSEMSEEQFRLFMNLVQKGMDPEKAASVIAVQQFAEETDHG